ncbi:2-hydroxyacid dehydrogenase [Leucobacter denitrificans]|uniref:2-hydroxyacid dehydrogenase n=1 Tax=Leucobacter denitrificans TaxID=683042 RepID=A0A7G9S256_9MICO|nr:2-hydroxyacid dehydrogenase [Leucobacter denitrificans]QNN61931.1 2-hydroxyacid dehydrogenase [Leucobacter denitrificans]
MQNLVLSLPSDPGLKDALVDALGEGSNVEIVDWDLDSPAPRDHIDIVVPPYWGGVKPFTRLADISTQLVQWQSIGYNGMERYLPEGRVVANATTVHEASTAELALALMLAAQRGLPKFITDGLEHKWDLVSYPSLADRKVLLIGYGGVGKAIEARLAGFETTVTRVARSARDEVNQAGETVHVHGFNELHDLLAEAEIAVIGLPLTDETRGIIGAAELAAMPDGALMVNVGRGPIMQTEALIAELESGRLRAAVDVTEKEPLPADDPLWDAPNVLITPHVGGDSSAMLPRMVALIKRQIGHLQAGTTPENIVLGEWK